MKITIASVGRWRSGPARDLYDDYVRRLSWTVSLKEVEVKKSLPVDARIAQEGELLLQASDGCDVLVALDERGKNLTSRDLAARFEQWQVDSRSAAAFVIGGADGLSQDVRRRADLTLALGAMTWPHMLARVMLIEQIYRASSILAGHPYHRG